MSKRNQRDSSSLNASNTASPPSKYPTRPTATLSTTASSDGSSAVELLTKLHRRSISYAAKAGGNALMGIEIESNTSSTPSTRSSSYAESYSTQWSNEYREDAESSSNSSYDEEGSNQGTSVESEEEDKPRHEKGWRGLNSLMPPSSKLSATTTPIESFDATKDVDFIPFPTDPYSLRHAEYGYDVDPAHRTTSIYTPGSSLAASVEEPGLGTYFATYLSYAMLIVIGHFRDFFGKWLFPGDYRHLQPHEVRSFYCTATLRQC